MPELERELRELRVEWPDTPDLAAAVAVRLSTAPAPAAMPTRRRWLDRPAWQLGVAVAAALIAVVMAVPPARSAVLEFLGLRSVKIERREPTPSRFGSGLGVGDPVTLAQARRRVGFPVLVPAEVGAPDAVYLYEHPVTGTRVDLVYRPRPGLPRASTTGAGLLVTEMHATIGPAIEKKVGASAHVERLLVGGDPALFISGADHGFAYLSPQGEMSFEPQRLAGPTLLVERGDGTLLRIEGKLSRDRAVEIAESAR
jgi:hypothetical protein